MRQDMFKKLVERPRHRAWRETRRAQRRRDMLDPESAPVRERMSRHGKTLNENLAPLRRYLLSQVGRQWDDVYSDIRKHLRARSITHLHVLQHLADMVVEHVVMVDGVPHQPYHQSYGGLTPLRPRRWSSVVWVDPKSGALRRVVPPPKPTAESDPDAVNVDANHVFRRIKGVWYRVSLAPLPQVGLYEYTRDVVEGCRLSELSPYTWNLGRELRRRYGFRDRYAADKVPLNKRQLKKLRHAGVLPY